MSKIIIKNARVICPVQNIEKNGNIIIEDGKIQEITEKDVSDILTDETQDNIIDGTGLIAAPGLVDMHVHLREPGQTHKEDIISGCKAAAAGGVTSVLAMPNTTPAIDNKETIEYVANVAKSAKVKVYIAGSISKGLTGLEATNIEEMKEAGAIALTDDGMPVINTRMMLDAMKKAKELNMAVVSHSEDLYLADEGIINEGEVSKELNVIGIPAAAEDCGTARDITLAESSKLPIHICHVSTETSVNLIRDAKNRGVEVTAETAPHYFTFTEKELLNKDADFRMNPPLRLEKDKEEIIKGLKDGTIDAIATDHAPHTVEEKQEFQSAPNGSIGVETSLSAGVTYLVKKDYLSYMELIKKMSTNPAKILGIEGGSLEPGKNADIVLFNPDEKWLVDIKKLNGKSKNTPYKNLELYGKVKYTIINGEIVYKS